MERLVIFDTTLRDGEQSPGASMTQEEKLRIALQLERLGVDVMEAGFAASSQGDFNAIHQIAQHVRESTVCSLARANLRDIERAGEAIKPAERRRIHTFIATSPLHMEKKLRMTPDEVLERAVAAVKAACQYTDDVEFSAEDGYRSELDFLARVCEATIAAGMATANSLAGVKIGGARQIECTINGLGERAGNCALEEVVMAVHTRRDYFDLETGIHCEQIVPASKLVSSITGLPIQPNKAVVGANAFAHASGIHQDGVLKSRETYEIMRAEDVGWSTNKIVLGKLSGRNAFRQRVKELGIPLASEAELNDAFLRFKDLADKKSQIFDEDIQALFRDNETRRKRDRYEFVSLVQSSETGERPTATVVWTEDGVEKRSSADGNGPVDASLRAIEAEVKSGAEMLLYSVNAITGGTESLGDVTVRLSKGGRVVNGTGADADIIAASAKAYLNALSKLASEAFCNPQHSV